MTWGQLTANRIAITRFFCGMAEQFAVADLYQNAIDVNGHRFIRTAFKVRDAGQASERFSTARAGRSLSPAVTLAWTLWTIMGRKAN